MRKQILYIFLIFIVITQTKAFSSLNYHLQFVINNIYGRFTPRQSGPVLSIRGTCVTVFMCACDGLKSSRGYNSKYNTRAESPKSKVAAAPATTNENTATRRGLGLSAWGIVTVIVSLILAIAGMYYFSICYPVLCQKNRKYDIMGLTPA